MPSKIEISYKTIVFTVFFLLSLLILHQIKDILYWLFVGFIIMSALRPTADFFEKIRIPRGISILVIYLFVLAIFVVFAGLIVPPLISQSVTLIERLPEYLERFLPFLTIDTQFITQQIGPLGENLVKVTVGIFNNLIAFFTIVVISFYLQIERKHLETYLADFMGEMAAKNVLRIIAEVEVRLGAWVRGQVLLACTVGTVIFIGLYFLGVPYSLPLSMLAGLLEIVPNIGPIFAAFPAVLVALTLSPFTALATVAFYFIVQQLENNLLVPYVMRTAVGMPPLVTIITLLIGAKLGGIGGLILSVPFVVTIQTILTEYLKVGESSSQK